MTSFPLEKWSTPHRETLLKRLQDCFVSEQSALHHACLYPVQTGGKRIRPLFLFAGLEALGHTVRKDAYTAAAAIELIHTYSLVHDDLPCMDNDDFRRGKPTVHKQYANKRRTIPKRNPSELRIFVATQAGDGL